MPIKKQIIRLKAGDLKQAKIKSLKQSAWELKNSGRTVSEQIQPHLKRKKPRYKESYEE